MDEDDENERRLHREITWELLLYHRRIPANNKRVSSIAEYCLPAKIGWQSILDTNAYSKQIIKGIYGPEVVPTSRVQQNTVTKMGDMQKNKKAAVLHNMKVYLTDS